MFGSYLKTALRHMRRRPHLAAVNIGGLALGLAGCILAVLFVRDEYAFDRFHPRLEDIFEVRSEVQVRNDMMSMETAGQVGPFLAATFPEVEAATRVLKVDTVIRKGDQAVMSRGLGVDPSFLRIFHFPLERGSAASALRDPSAVVLTRETARRLFGSADPVGQVLSVIIGKEILDLRIEGVAAEIPASSSLDFDFLLPITRAAPGIDRGEDSAACFIRLREGARPETLAARFPGSLDKFLSSYGTAGRHYLFPFAEYHRGAGDHPFSSVLGSRSSPLYSALLTAIALLILLIAVLNFMNLNVGAAAADRIKEIGLRKVFGADRRKLFQQFRIEAILLSLAGLAVGFGIASLVLPAFNRFSGKALRLDPAGIGWTLPILAVFAVLVGAAAGSYPGWVMNRRRPMELFRETFFLGRRGGFNRVFLFLQCGISIFLLITTMVLYRQHRFLLTTDLGFDAERVAVLDLRQIARQSPDASRIYSVLKSRLSTHPEIQSVSGAYSGMTSWSARGLRLPGADRPEFIRINEVDAGFLETLGIPLKEGRWFSGDDPTGEPDAVVVNEAFVRRFASSDPIGRSLAELTGFKTSARIIGVVRDFHFDSLHKAIQPAMMTLGREPPRWAYLRLQGGDIARAVKIIEQEYEAVVPGFPFLLSFLDEETARLYEDEARWSSMVGIVSIFAVLIACAGVFGLAVQSSVRRRREIGIRRVLGASVRQISGLINREFLTTAATAGLIAWPAAFLTVRKILAAYPYRVSSSPWVFAAGTAAMLALVLLAVSLQTLRAARADPAATLRSE